MHQLLKWAAALLLGAGLASCDMQSGRVERPRDSAKADADNTARNERDRSATSVTPGDQSETAADRELAANVRKAIVDDNTLSVNAHNVKVITSQGTVTLRGPVKSAAEKQAVETKARQVAGVSNVINQLEVESNP